MKLNIKILIFGYLDVKRQNVEGKESKKGVLKYIYIYIYIYLKSSS